ncbi:putative membrane-associated trancriptional regulator [Halanaeroarchaeum sp. HSR-CO]|uniref:helix-turn-helix transcriptional regulator n=1 Tax=Halanaeroarchaeum sp. HSR-CO TaxID=2866382 RepID=UPI00217DC3FF|nr:hypothetical protein [Halanaeroarchaeum sp. HSR-CO]UWG46632.1 putative membrane-associated trancriptional regulator [Halanaeroarchaeum sp. HSR-CO]
MRRVALLLVVLSVLVSPMAGTAQAQSPPPAPDTQFHITVQEDGDARWDVTVRIPLENETDERAFETLRAEFESGTADDTLSVDPFREAAARVSERTGQSMTITRIDRTTNVGTVNGTPVGHLTLSFTWTNFAEIGEDEVQVGAAFAGGWFGDLGPNQTLSIEPPAGYKVHTVEPLQAITNGTLQWDGPQAFGPGQPVVTFEPIPPGPLPVSLPVAASMALIAGVVVGGLVLLGWRRGWVQTVAGDGSSAETDDAPTEPGPAAGTGQETGPEKTPVGTPPTTDEGDEAADLELLSDEERVERLLEKHGGRMKQARIVEETRWSNAKVSQLLSSMAEEGRVEKLRLGRENLISLPDEDI